MRRVRDRPTFNYDEVLKENDEIVGAKAKLVKKIRAGEKLTQEDELQWQDLADRQSRNDVKVNKLVEKFQRYAQLSKERIDRRAQAVAQGLQSPQAGVFTYLAVAFVTAANAIAKRRHNNLYREILPIRNPKRRDVRENARYMDMIIARKIFT